jgi:hypothetical protein
MALRCVAVIRGISRPFVVLTISSIAEALGDVVPMPALPVAGNMFCAWADKAINIVVEAAIKYVVFITGEC